MWEQNSQQTKGGLTPPLCEESPGEFLIKGCQGYKIFTSVQAENCVVT